MIVLGLTGSIGMGKSTAARCFRQLGIPVHDADAEIHKLMASGGWAVPEIEKIFPDVVRDGAIDRALLGGRVFGDPKALKRLESILHPMVRSVQRTWLRSMAVQAKNIVVLDIPLLFETGGARRCDFVVVVSAPRRVQERRVLSRPGMTPEKFEAIIAKQMPDREKRRRADFVINSTTGFRDCLKQAAEVARLCLSLPARRRRPA